LLATNFIPLAGELIVYDVDDNHPKIRAKVGNGTDLLSALPWAIDETCVVWTGTQAEYKTLNDADAIAVGTVVIITDDNDTATGGSGDAAGGTTTAKLGTAVLGTMILGQE
jgi:hypothetical protein